MHPLSFLNGIALHTVLLMNAYWGWPVALNALFEEPCNSNALIGKAFAATVIVASFYALIDGAFSSLGWPRTWHWWVVGPASYVTCAIFLSIYASALCGSAGKDSTMTFASFLHRAMTSEVTLVWRLVALEFFTCVVTERCLKKAVELWKASRKRKLDQAADGLADSTTSLQDGVAEDAV